MGQLMDDKHGQMIVINLMFLVMTIMVFTAMLPILKTSLNNARHYDALNCASNINKCNDGEFEIPCYNASLETNSVGCLLLDLYIPYIVIVVLMAGVAKLLAQRAVDYFAPQQQPAYGY